jgi:hypothetical protein
MIMEQQLGEPLLIQQMLVENGETMLVTEW